MRAHARGPFSLLSGNDTFVMSADDEQPLTPREQLEYTELRATIRQRGTARVCIFAAGLAAWAALTLATAALASTPLATEPLSALPGLSRGTDRVPLHRLGDTQLLGFWLAAAVLPDGRRIRTQLP